jgi:DUF2975 family protein
MPRTESATLPTAHVVLRILIVLNWLYGAAVLTLLTVMFVAPHWTFTALKITPSSGIPSMITGLRAIAALGLVAVPIYYAIFKRLLAMVGTVRAGDPFVAENADRLQSIAWSLLALQVLSMVIGGIAKVISTPAHPLHLNAGFSTNGWLAVILTFVLARVFAAGTLMREDLEGTV